MKNILEEFEVFENDATEAQIAAAGISNDDDDVAEYPIGFLEYGIDHLLNPAIKDLHTFLGLYNITEIKVNDEAFNMLMKSAKFRDNITLDLEALSVIVQVNEIAQVRFVLDIVPYEDNLSEGGLT